MKIKNKKRFSITVAIGILLFTSGVFALNGWFGGGASVPSDTFTRGLMGYWSFDEGASTTAYDISGNGNNGTLTSMSATSSWVRGKINGALSFDGTDDYVDAGNGTGLQVSTVLTAELWLYPRSTTNYQKPLAKGQAWNDGWWIQSDIGTSNFGLSFVGNSGNFDSTRTSLDLNTWTHFVAIFDAGVVKIYKNGIEVSSQSSGSTVINGTTVRNLEMGRESGGGFYFNGLIDEVRVYNRALSAAEVRYHYNRGGPVAYWNFDEGVGTTTYDGTENNNDGVMTNMSATSSWVAGRYGSALRFDGTDDRVSVSDSAILDTDYVTAEVWIKMENVKVCTGCAVVGKHFSGGGGDRNWEITIDNAGRIYFQFSRDGSESLSAETGNGAVSPGNWYHLVGTYNGINGKIYVNGSLAGTSANFSGTLYKNTRELRIGNNYNTNLSNGIIDDVRIYGYARTAEEIRLDYNAGFAARFGMAPTDCNRNPAACADLGLVGYWDFNEQGSALTYDKSGSGNDGLINDGGSGNPVAYWTFDEGTGTTTYDYIGVNNGTLGNGTNATTMPSWTRNGKVGGALSFDGTNDYVNLGDKDAFSFGDSLTDSAFTIEAWVKFNALGGDNTIVNKGITSSNAEYYLAKRSTNLFQFRIRDESVTSHANITSTQTAIAGQWYHVVATYDGRGGATAANGMSLYINGVFEILSDQTTEVAYVAMQNGSDALTIGKISNNDWPQNGSIDDVRIYNYARTAAQIQQDYLETYKSKYTTGAPAIGGGYQGSALQFDGVNDWVSVEDSTSLDIFTDITIEAWVKANATTNSDIIEKGGCNGYMIFLRASISTLEFTKQCDSSSVAVSAAIVTGRWYHVVAVKSGSVATIYLDGVQSGQDTSFANFGDVGALSIGRGTTGDGYFNGLIDEVRIYNRALSVEEIRYHYNKGGPVGWWKFDEGLGTTTSDSTWNNNNGILTNMVATSSWVQGKYGSALVFDGADDYIDVGNDSSLNITGDLTIGVWFKANKIGAYQEIIGKFDGGPGTNESYEFRVRDTGYLQFCQGNGVSTPCYQNNTALSAGKWYYLAVTRDGKNIKFYIDSSLDAIKRQNESPTGDTTHNVWIGWRNDSWGNGWLNGALDDLKVYNYVRTQEQIREDYNQGTGARFGPSSGSGQAQCDIDPGACMTEGLAGYWSMDEGGGPLVFDKSGNGNDGMINDKGSGSPVAYWTFDEGTGTTTYDYISTNNGTLGNGTNATTMPSWTRNGRVGGALIFDGVNDYVNMGDPSSGSLDPSVITVEAWVYRGADTGRWETIVDKRSYPNSGYYLGYDGSGSPEYFRFAVFDGSEALVDTTGITMDVGQWYHVVGLYDGTNSKIFVNGTSYVDTSVGASQLSASPNNLYIGAHWDLTESSWFRGMIDDVRIYNYARNAVQIKQDYLETYRAKYAAGAPIPGGGYQGSSLQFDGTDDFMEVTTSTINNPQLNPGTGSLSVEAWVKSSKSDYQYFLNKGTVQNGAGMNGYLMWFSTNYHIQFQIQDGGASLVTVGSGAANNDGAWHHVVGVIDRSANLLRLYIDGVGVTPVDISGYTSAINPSQNLYVGAYGNPGSHAFTGSVDGVRIYSRVLSAEEVRYHYNKGGPVAYWKFDEGSGATSTDATWNNNDGTLTNMASTTAWVQGKYGSALLFDGVDDYVSVGTNSSLSPTSVTWTAWIKTTSSDRRMIFSRGGNQFQIDNSILNPYVRIGSDVSNTDYGLTGTARINDNKWHFVAATYQGNSFKAYVDGKLDAQRNNFSGDMAPQTSSTARIGAFSAQYFNGLIDDVRVYNYARTQDQLLQDYNQGLSAYFK